MPEGPEVRRQADRLHAVLADQKAERVFFAFPELAEAAEALTGRRVESVSARGKAMLTTFEGGRVVYTHNQLYGRWYVRKVGGEVRTRRQLRFEVQTSTHRALLFSASTIEVLLEGELDHHPFISRLGPDPLSDPVQAIEARFKDVRFAGRRLAQLLLEQEFVAGLGNYLRSEILHHARIAPTRRPKELSSPELRRLAKSTYLMCNRSYELGGITRPPSEAKRMKAAGQPRWKYRHYVFGRARGRCPRCEEAIRKDTLAGRRLYWCSNCQA
ncbi:MAG: endonuclease VIII [Myxococcota bacterium]